MSLMLLGGLKKRSKLLPLMGQVALNIGIAEDHPKVIEDGPFAGSAGIAESDREFIKNEVTEQSYWKKYHNKE